MISSNATRVERDAHRVLVRLDSTSTAARAPAARSTLDALLSDSAEVVLDVGALERVDASGLQLVLAFVAARRARGLAWSFDPASPALHEAARVGGPSRQLSLVPSEQPIA